MYYFRSIFILFTCSIFLNSCHGVKTTDSSLHSPDNKNIHYTGRIDFSNPEKPKISGAAAYFQLKFRGSWCDILLEDQNFENNHNYIAVVIDGKYSKRIRVSKEKARYGIAENLEDTIHTLLVCKATESQTGYIEFKGILCDEILALDSRVERKIEFIGNSITCGMGVDTSEIPCRAEEWYDNHNAWYSYGPRAARKLNASWLLSSVSGIGMNRNWNSPGPTMPEVYDNTFLSNDSGPLWDYKTYIPDMVSVCLGHNDFSDGDGSYEREELDSASYVNDYIRFIEKIREQYPEAQICCLTSPMLSGDRSIRLANFLSAVINYMKEVKNDKKICMFRFQGSYNSGCDYHPDMEEQKMIAKELLPFYKKVMNW